MAGRKHVIYVSAVSSPCRLNFCEMVEMCQMWQTNVRPRQTQTTCASH